MFWEDIHQAAERLPNSYILYGDDVVSVVRCETRKEGPSAQVYFMKDGREEWKSLDDPLFHDFHRLPPLGFVNVVSLGKPTAILLTRLPERSRIHGLKNSRVKCEELTPAGLMKSSKTDYSRITTDKGYSWRIANSYPTASEIMEKLPDGCSAAFSPTYGISKDSFGISRLFRRGLAVGIIHENGLRLTKQTAAYREELEESAMFNIDNIEVS